LQGVLAKPADVYAFGIMLFEVFTGQRVFVGQTAIAISHNVLHKDVRPQFPPGVSIKIVELACQCWAKDPEMRPTFSYVMDKLEGMKASFGMNVDDKDSTVSSGDGTDLNIRRFSNSQGSDSMSGSDHRHSGFDIKHLQMMVSSSTLDKRGVIASFMLRWFLSSSGHGGLSRSETLAWCCPFRCACHFPGSGIQKA
jgi:hypothetical protein